MIRNNMQVSLNRSTWHINYCTDSAQTINNFDDSLIIKDKIAVIKF